MAIKAENLVSEKTFSDNLDAHAEDVRERYMPKVPKGLKVIYPAENEQPLPLRGSDVTNKTFSDNADAHAED